MFTNEFCTFSHAKKVNQLHKNLKSTSAEFFFIFMKPQGQVLFNHVIVHRLYFGVLGGWMESFVYEIEMKLALIKLQKHPKCKKQKAEQTREVVRQTLGACFCTSSFVTAFFFLFFLSAEEISLEEETLQITQLFNSSLLRLLPNELAPSFHHLVIRMCSSSLPREAKNGYHL